MEKFFRFLNEKEGTPALERLEFDVGYLIVVGGVPINGRFKENNYYLKSHRSGKFTWSLGYITTLEYSSFLMYVDLFDIELVYFMPKTYEILKDLKYLGKLN